MPVRIQRRRTKGWRKPANTVIVSRPSRWGNPFYVDVWGPERAVELFREYMDEMKVKFPEQYRKLIEPLIGKDLACFCPLDKPCHSTVLLELASQMETK